MVCDGDAGETVTAVLAPSIAFGLLVWIVTMIALIFVRRRDANRGKRFIKRQAMERNGKSVAEQISERGQVLADGDSYYEALVDNTRQGEESSAAVGHTDRMIIQMLEDEYRELIRAYALMFGKRFPNQVPADEKSKLSLARKAIHLKEGEAHDPLKAVDVKGINDILDGIPYPNSA